MKAILEFNLPEDQPEFNTALQGSDWRGEFWRMMKENNVDLYEAE